jgi:hypothetical protein
MAQPIVLEAGASLGDATLESESCIFPQELEKETTAFGII